MASAARLPPGVLDRATRSAPAKRSARSSAAELAELARDVVQQALAAPACSSMPCRSGRCGSAAAPNSRLALIQPRSIDSSRSREKSRRDERARRSPASAALEILERAGSRSRPSRSTSSGRSRAIAAQHQRQPVDRLEIGVAPRRRANSKALCSERMRDLAQLAEDDLAADDGHGDRSPVPAAVEHQIAGIRARLVACSQLVQPSRARPSRRSSGTSLAPQHEAGVPVELGARGAADEGARAVGKARPSGRKRQELREGQRPEHDAEAVAALRTAACRPWRRGRAGASRKPRPIRPGISSHPPTNSSTRAGTPRKPATRRASASGGRRCSQQPGAEERETVRQRDDRAKAGRQAGEGADLEARTGRAPAGPARPWAGRSPRRARRATASGGGRRRRSRRGSGPARGVRARGRAR